MKFNLKKILIIRFSSIGDVVLTTPVIRCVKKQYPQAEIHFLTKPFNEQFLSQNPYIDKLYLYQKGNLPELVELLKKEHFDFVIDLQRNLRSRRIRMALSCPSRSFSKLNIRKWLLVHTKWNCMPKLSVVDRYFQAAQPLLIQNDGLGLDFFLKEESVELPEIFKNPFVAIACGAQHGTKQIPVERIEFLLKRIQKPVVLLGDEKDAARISSICFEEMPYVFNACGKFSLNQSALILQKSVLVITPDTGLMHISAALQKKIVSLWGNTVPEFGMYPYLPAGRENLSTIMEVRGLKCRPCSKLGFKECPKGHFNCMQKIDYNKIIEMANAVS